MSEKKIINLFEFERPVPQKQFFPIAASVWIINPSGIYDGTLYEIMEPELINDYRFFSLYDVKASGVTLTEEISYNNVISNSSTWYYDGVTLYVHFPNSNTPYSYADGEIVIGAYQGYYTSTNDKELSLFGGLYDPRLVSFPIYRAQLDNFASGKQAIAGGTVILDNSDGALDNFSFGRDPDTLTEVLPKIGWYGRIRQAILDVTATAIDSDFKVIAQGFTTKITENVSVNNGYGISIDLKDIRASLDKDIPLAKLSATTYNKMSSKDIATPPFVPMIYGKVSKYLCFCLNETITPAGNKFKYLLGNATLYDFTAINKIYIQTKETTIAPTIQYETQSTGERIAFFEINASDFVKVTATTPSVTFDYVGYTEVSADIEGYDNTGLIENGLDIVADLILQTYGEAYNTENYNTTAWGTIHAIAPDCGIVIDKPTPIKSIIEEVQKTIPLSQFNIDDGQKYSWVDYSWDDNGIIFEILPDAFPRGYIPSPDVDAEQIAAKIQVNYDYRHTLQSWARETDDSNATIALDKFNTDRTYPEEYNTVVSTEAGATSIINRLKEQFFYPNTVLNLSIPMIYKSMGIFAYELLAGDKVKILANVPYKQLYGYLGCIVHEIKQNIETMQIDITLKVIYNSNLTYKQPCVIQSPYNQMYLGDGAFVFGGII